MLSYIVNQVVENYHGRKVVLWGAYEPSYNISSHLKVKKNIQTAFYVDSNPVKMDGVTVYAPECLREGKSEYYVVIPLLFHQSLKDQLEGYGYQKERNYCYYYDQVVIDREDYYEDSRGNRIVGLHRGLKFGFDGVNSLIRVGEGVHLSPETKILMKSNGVFEIGSGSRIQGKMFSICQDNAHIYIGNHCIIGNDLALKCRDNASIKVGNRVTFTSYNSLEATTNSSVSLGDDCMLASFIDIRSGDSHSIFDVETGYNINSTPEVAKSRKIVIGNHVWIGVHAIVLSNTVIGDGSIVGAGSLVKNKIANNCIAAGVPARVIRRNIAWSRKEVSDNILDCGEEYIQMTRDDSII